MSGFTVVITDIAWPATTIEEQVLAPLGADLIVASTGEEDELVQLVPHAHAIMVNWRSVSARVLRAAPHCLTVARYGVGLDNIDVGEATRLGMVVSNVPDYCIEEVSDHTIALLMACARGIATFARTTRSGEWNLRAHGPLGRVSEQTLGLVGFGRMAQAVARKAAGLGLRVLAYKPRSGHHAAASLVDFTTDLDSLLRASDYVSVHVPLTAETRHMISEDQFAAMKPTAYLINTARGSVVDQAALERALSNGRIAGAALDVLESEPADPADTLLRLDNVIVTPHAAFSSAISIPELQRKTAENVATILRGELPAMTVNPAVVNEHSYATRRASRQCPTP
jgi:D-3-phosphoglycerate dehydrogenase